MEMAEPGPGQGLGCREVSEFYVRLQAGVKGNCGRAGWEQRWRQKGPEPWRMRGLSGGRARLRWESSRTRHNNHGNVAGALGLHGGYGEDIDSGSSACGKSIDRGSTQ